MLTPTPPESTGSRAVVKKVLLVDDEPVILELMRHFLHDIRCVVHAVDSGELAWDALEREAFDLVVTDVQLGGISGIELVRKMRAAGISVPVLLASGSVPLDLLAIAPELELSGVFEKPFEGEAFARAVQEILWRDKRTSGTEV